MQTMKSTADSEPTEADPRFCTKCGRSNLDYRGDEPYKAGLCKTCELRAWQVERWKRLAGQPLLEATWALGVGPRFCKDAQPPGFGDDGLKGRLEQCALPSGGLWVIGPVGSHKTHLLSARVVDAARRGYSAHLVSWSWFALEVRDTYKASAQQSEADIIRHYLKYDLLCIDDFGISTGEKSESDAAIRLAYELFDERYKAADRITDISGNLTPPEMEIAFGPRIVRRLQEMTTVYPMLLGDKT